MTTKPKIARLAHRRRALPRLADRLPLGEVEVSPFCLGRVDDPRAVPAAFDAGINFFFVSADMHWPLYDAQRRGLAMLLARRRSIRDEIVVAAVSYVTQPEFCRVPFDEALDAVPRLERLDMTVIGGAYAGDFFVRLGAYAGHRTGSIRGRPSLLGASFHDRHAAATAFERGLVDLGFCRYNAAHRGAETDIFPVRRKAPLYAFKSTSAWVSSSRLDGLGVPRDVWRPDVTDHYRFVLTSRDVDGVLCAPRTPKEVRALDDALARGPLDAGDVEHLTQLARLDAGTATLG